MAGKKKKLASPPGTKVVAKNRKALFDYEVVERLEAGVQLVGSEVKSLREGKVVMGDAYASIEGGEAFLHSLHIPEYVHGAYANHDPIRVRKLLLHRQEIDKLYERVREKGMTLVPLELYFKQGRAKVQIGLVRGKARHDKRHSIRERDEARAAAREEA
ncbi:MAG: SsrA-binding protein SmpB [Myxococcales bacterium]|nr:SsrA-binding protein SmpB [Myxococcales bacterium]